MDHVLLIVLGMAAGAVYAALAVGLVVVYKGTGTINFAQGSLAMWSAFIFDTVKDDGELVLPVGSIHVGNSTVVALLLGVGTTALIALAWHQLVHRAMRSAPPLAKVVASVGLMLTLEALAVIRFGADTRSVAQVLPNEAVSLGALTFSRDRLYLVVIVVLMTAALAVWFRLSRVGLAMRGAAENPTAAMLSGYSASGLAAVSWVIASVASGVMAILVGPSNGLTATTFTLFVVPALAAALLGRLQSLGIACAAGLAIGAFQAEIGNLSTRSWWPDLGTIGVADAVPFVIIVVALFVGGRRLPARDDGRPDRLPEVPRSRPRPIVVSLLALGALAALALTSGSYRFALVTSMIFAVISMSLVVVCGLIGQISLAQAALAGTAGFALSRISAIGVPFPLSLVIASVVATAVGVVVGVPALRIRGAQLAVVTLASAVAIERLIFNNPAVSPPGGNPIPAASLFGLDLGVRSRYDIMRLPFGVMVLVFLVVTAVAVMNLARGGTGRAFLAVRSNERAAAAVGLDVARVKLLAFAVSSFIAGLGGCLIGMSRGQMSTESFGVFVGLSFLAFAYIGGITSVQGALVAGALAPLGIVYVLADRNIELGHYYELIGGIGLVMAALQHPSGVAGTLRRKRSKAVAGVG